MTTENHPHHDSRDHFPPILYVITRSLDVAGFAALFLFFFNSAVLKLFSEQSAIHWLPLCLGVGFFCLSFVLCIAYEHLHKKGSAS